MDATKWAKVKEILELALDIERDARAAFLVDQDISPEIRSEVESLLSVEEDAGGMLEVSAIAFTHDFLADDALIGQEIGAYKVIGELGHGGMGAVYLAERVDGKFTQRVALKLLKREMNSGAIRRRFRREREILARLDHQNIARLLDAGTTGDKIPFLAMEYVDGLPIDEYCDRNELGLEDRLDLFRKVCSVVDFAHRSLVVHRDLKPSNILVTADGTPKLLDFGISKIVTDEADNTASVTRLGVMTPNYAAPEQLRGESVTTAADIYSLGVILYQLLSGRRPFENKESDIKEILKSVTEVDPPLPSSIIQSETGPRGGAWRSNGQPSKVGQTERLSGLNTSSRTVGIKPQAIRGDLDNIILKALKKEPERRYLSAESIAEDIRRHLEGLPVAARPDTFPYRAEKFIKRNSISVIASVLIAAAVVGGVGATLWQAGVAREQSYRARVEAEKSRKVNEYMKNVLSFSNPLWSSSNPDRKQKATIDEALEQALKNLETDLASEPEIQAEILFTIGETYTGQSQFAKAESLLRRSIELFDQVLGSPNSRSVSASVTLADVLYYSGKSAEAETLYTSAIPYLEPRVDVSTNRKYLVVALNNLGNVYMAQSKPVEARRSILAANTFADQLLGRDRNAAAIAAANYGAALYHNAEYAESKIQIEKGNNMLVEMGAGQSYEAGQMLNALGRTCVELGEFSLAEAKLREGHDILLKTVGEKNTYFAQNSLTMSAAYFRQRKLDAARAQTEKTILLFTDLFPNGHLNLGNTFRLLGEIFTKSGDLATGETHLRKALEMSLKFAKEPNHNLAMTRLALGENLAQQKRYNEAREHVTASITGFVATRGEEHPWTKNSREVLSRLP